MWRYFGLLRCSLHTDARGIELFLNHRVLDHVDAITGSNFAFDCDLFRGVLGELTIERLVFADEQIRFAVICFQPDGQSAHDALFRAIGMFLAGGVVIDVTGHIDHFAGNLFRLAGCEFVFLAMLVAFMSDGWIGRKDDCSCNRRDDVSFFHFVVFVELRLMKRPRTHAVDVAFAQGAICAERAAYLADDREFPRTAWSIVSSDKTAKRERACSAARQTRR